MMLTLLPPPQRTASRPARPLQDARDARPPLLHLLLRAVAVLSGGALLVVAHLCLYAVEVALCLRALAHALGLQALLP